MSSSEGRLAAGSHLSGNLPRLCRHPLNMVGDTGLAMMPEEGGGIDG